MSVVNHHFVRPLLAISLALFLLAGLAGISVHVHYCHGNRTDVDFFPEIIKSGTSCKCESFTKDHSINANVQKCSHSSCCTDRYFFKKLNIETNFQVFQTGVKNICFFPLAENRLAAINPLIYFEVTRKPAVVPEPPGRKRVILFHQFRVSATQGDCQG